MSLYQVRQFHNFPQLLNSSAELFSHSTAFTQKSKGGEFSCVSYSDFKNYVISLGCNLVDMGFKNENIAICAANCVSWCVAYMASAIYCSCVVPIDKELTCEDILQTIDKSKSKVLITDEKTYKKLTVKPDIKIIGIDFENGEVKKLSDYLNKEVSSQLPEKRENSPSVMLFTSGTTGKAKAVVLSQENICFDISAVMKIVKINHGEKILSLLPLHHTYECSITFLCCLYAGVNICFGGGILDIYKDFKLFSPDILVVVPLILKGVYSKIKKLPDMSLEMLQSKISDFLGGKLRMIVCGAAPIEGDVLKSISRFVPTIIQGYGLTECSPIALCNPDFDTTFDTVGKPLPETQAKIINPDENGTGEICVKGKMVMLGYFDGEKINNACESDGWYHTGDLGKIDENGNYIITGRLKNVIVTPNGKNIYPEELEFELTAYPEITEAMVYEGKDSRETAAVCAKIVTDGDFEAVKAIIKKVNAQNAQYKAIKSFEICDNLPKNTSFKIIRNK